MLIDPYLSRIGKLGLLFGRPSPDTARIARYLDGLPAPLAAILVGHTHVDHALDVPALVRLAAPDGGRTAIVGSRSLDRLFDAHGQPGRVRVCRGGETLALGEGLVVRIVRSAHGRVLGSVPYPGEVAAGLRAPLRASAYQHGTVFAFRVEMGGRALVHVGSAAAPPEPVGPCDVAYVCVSGWRQIPDFVPRLIEAVQPEAVVPFHWDDFTAPLREGHDPPRAPFVDVAGFVAGVARCAPRVQVRQVGIGEEMGW